MAILKSLGFVLVAVALAVLPLVIWVSNKWAIVCATAGLAGLGMLGIALRAGRK